jgi:UDP-glucose 4-epimerase
MAYAPRTAAAGTAALPGTATAIAPVFNVCTGVAVSVIELATTIAALAGVTADIRHAPPRPGEIRHSVGSPDLAREALGLAAPAALRDGLPHVLAWLGAPA